MRILVIGGSGLIGSRLVGRLRQRGHEVVSASRSSRVDAVTGIGLPEAMEAARVVIDVTNPPSPDSAAARDFFLSSGNNISAAEAGAGVEHHLVLSVVGADRLDGGYFRAKVLQEDLVRGADTPFTVIRSTQFFEFMLTIAAANTEDRIVRLPDALIQPVAADDVAEALTVAALQPPANRIIELAGPEPLRLSDAVARVLAARDDQRQVIADPDASYFGVHLGERTLMPASNPRIAPTSLDTWLAKGRQLP